MRVGPSKVVVSMGFRGFGEMVERHDVFVDGRAGLVAQSTGGVAMTPDEWREASERCEGVADAVGGIDMLLDSTASPKDQSDLVRFVRWLQNLLKKARPAVKIFDEKPTLMAKLTPGQTIRHHGEDFCTGHHAALDHAEAVLSKAFQTCAMHEMLRLLSEASKAKPATPPLFATELDAELLSAETLANDADFRKRVRLKTYKLGVHIRNERRDVLEALAKDAPAKARRKGKWWKVHEKLDKGEPTTDKERAAFVSRWREVNGETLTRRQLSQIIRGRRRTRRE